MSKFQPPMFNDDVSVERPQTNKHTNIYINIYKKNTHTEQK